MARFYRSLNLQHACRLHVHPLAANDPRKLRLPSMPTIRDLLHLYKLNAQKHLSQNFLLEPRLIDKIAKAAGHKSRGLDGVHVVEVGPGPGGISRSLFKRGAEHVTVIEKDLRFRPTLEMLEEACGGRLAIYWGDVLSFNMSNLFPEDMRHGWEEGEVYPDRLERLKSGEEEEEVWQPYRRKKVKGRLPKLSVVGNLPFNISTPLVIRWIKDISNRENIWSYGRVPMTLTFQKEVAERIVASIGDEKRCRLSVMCQNWCYVDLKFIIPGSAFIPKPKVDVGVVRLVPRPTPRIPLPFPLVEKVVRTLFSSRQKYIKHTASYLFPPIKGDTGEVPSRQHLVDEFLLLSDIKPDIRPFGTTIEEFGRLCHAYQKMCERYPILEKYVHQGHKGLPKGHDFMDDEYNTDEDNLEKKWEGFDDAVGKFEVGKCASVLK